MESQPIRVLALFAKQMAPSGVRLGLAALLQLRVSERNGIAPRWKRGLCREAYAGSSPVLPASLRQGNLTLRSLYQG